MKKNKKNDNIVIVDEDVNYPSNDNVGDALSLEVDNEISVVDNSENNNELSLIDNEYSITNAGESEILQKYIKHVSQFPILTKEEEDKLLSEYIDKGNQNAGKLIILSHLRLVAKIAVQYRRYGINIMDIISEGNVGLMQALKNFDRSKNVRFSTYALLWIRACVQDFILKSWSLVKIGTTALRKQLLFNLRGVKKALKINQNTSNEEKNKKLAEHFNVSETEMENISSSLSQRDTSLEAPIEEGEGLTLMDTYSKDYGDFDNELANEEDKKYKMKIFRESLSVLNERQKEILIARYLNEKKATLDELSKKYCISKERVRQIEESAIKKLREFAEQYDK